MIQQTIVQFLVNIGLVVIPLIIVKGYAPRQVKEPVALMLALAIGLTALYLGNLKKVTNKWIVILFFFMLLSTFFVIKSPLVVGYLSGNSIMFSDNSELDNIWNWKPLFYAFVYLLMFISIISSEINVEFVFKIISWVSLLVATYCILQKFGFEQFLRVKSVEVIGTPKSAAITGTIGQPTLAAMYLAMCFPVLIYLNKYWFMLISLIAIVFCRSNVAYGALIIGMIALFTSKYNKFMILVSLVSIILLFIATIYMFHVKLPDSGRFHVWNLTFNDIKMPFGDDGPRFALTGFGAGAFHYLFSAMHKSTWLQTHNEYLEFAYNYGLIGLSLLLISICSVFGYILNLLEYRYIRYLGCMFLIICVNALGSFPWQLGVTTFYTVVILGLIYNLGDSHAMA
jgi:hypothetical protein